MRLRGAALLILSAYFFGCEPPPPHAPPLEESEHKAVFGEDDRRDVYEHPEEAWRALSRTSIVALVNNWNIDETDPDNVHLSGPPLGEAYALCEDQRYRDQPSAAFCSGTLVGPDVVLTAGHCIDQGECPNVSFVFDNYYEAPGRLAQVTSDSVYRCAAILDRELVEGSYGADFALVRLDRAVTPDRRPVPIWRGDAPLPLGTSVTMIGGPSGLPTKITSDGVVTLEESGDDYFGVDLDAFGGNSGSGVFNDAGEVVGVLVRGMTDYIEDGACRRVNVLPQDMGAEHVFDIRHALGRFCPTGSEAAPLFCEGESGQWCFACDVDADCQDGFVCHHPALNPGVGSCVAPCQGDGDCAFGHACSDNVCAPMVGAACHEDNVWSMDACGRELAVAEDCVAAGQGCLQGACQPRDRGDRCDTAIPVAAESQIIEAEFGAIIDDDFRASCGGGARGPDHVYRFTLDAPTEFTAFSLGFDTVLHLRSACGLDSPEILCNDDSNVPGEGGSRIAGALEAGEYFLVVDAYQSDASGGYALVLNFGGQCDELCRPEVRACDAEDQIWTCVEEANGCFSWTAPEACAEDQRCYVDHCVLDVDGDTCEDPTLVQAVSQSIQGDLTNYQNDGAASCGGNGPDHVYAFDLEHPAQLTATVSGFDSVLYLVEDCASVLACTDDSDPPGSLGSQLQADLEPGRYYVFVDAYNNPGAYTLDLDFGRTCEDLCEEGALRCAGQTGFDICATAANGCLDWVEGVGCGEGELCRDAACAVARTINVPGDFATLDEALADSASGDAIIRLGAGVFDQPEAEILWPLIIVGEGPGQTTIMGDLKIGHQASVQVESLSIQGSEFMVGGASQRTAGIRIFDGEVTTFNVEIFDAEAGIYGLNATINIYATRIYRNYRGLDLELTSGQIINNEIMNNEFFGYKSTNSDMLLANNTLLGNGFSAFEQDGEWYGGPALALYEGRDAAVNNIIVGNQNGLEITTQGGFIGYNDVWGNIENYSLEASPGEGDLSVDPRFVNVGEGDLRLAEGSPCIDAGYEIGLAWDFHFRPRPYGAGTDMGAHEFSRSEAALILNEVMANPRNENTGEYVEIYNMGDAPADVAGFILDDGDAQTIIEGWAGGATVIPAGAYAVILDRDYTEEYEIPAEAVRLTVEGTRLGNGLAVSDPVTLLDAEGVVVSTYLSPFNPGNGVSAERTAPELADEPAAWQPSPCGESAGRPNCTFEIPPIQHGDAQLRITEVMSNPLDENTGEFIEILNIGDTPAELAGLIIDDGDSTDALEAFGPSATLLEPGAYAVILDPDFAGEYDIPGDALLMTVGNTRIGDGLATTDPIALWTADNALLSTYTDPFNAGNGYSVEMVAVELGDVAGNWRAAACEAAPFASPGAPNCVSGGSVINPAALTLVINEVMSNALDEDTGEFVELYNYGDAPVDAAGLILDDGDATDALTPVNGDGVIPAGGYALIMDPEYAGEYTIPEGVVILHPTDTTLGSGLATTDPLTLLASDGVTVISTYAAPFNPGNGISAELIDAQGGDAPANWIASPCASGASPGRLNCSSDGPVDPPIVDATVLINEVMANPLDEGVGEYVELVNVGAEPVDLAGYILTDLDADDTIEGWQGGSTVLAAGAYAVILDRDYDGSFAVDAAALKLTIDDRTLGSGLTNDDPIQLLTPDGATVLSSYSHPFDPGNGISVERVSLAEGDVGGNWIASPCDLSPGAPNCAAGGEEPPPPDGEMIDVNTADVAELSILSGIGATTANRIIEHRLTHGTIEDLYELLAIPRITVAQIEGWAQLEAGETHYLGVDPAVANPAMVFGSVAALRATLNDPALAGQMEGQVVRIERAVNYAQEDDGRLQRFSFGDWGDQAAYFPWSGDRVEVQLEGVDRAALSLLDVVEGWSSDLPLPYAPEGFYDWSSPLTRLGAYEVYTLQGRLQQRNGVWQLQIRPSVAPGADRLVRYETWLNPERWATLEALWSYNFTAAHITTAEGALRLPRRLAQAHPCNDFWVEQVGHRPALPIRISAATPADYTEFNEALAAWLETRQGTCVEDNNTLDVADPLDAVEGRMAICGADDEDWYIADLEAGCLLSVDVLFDDEMGDIDVSLTDAAGVRLASGMSTSDNERVEHLARLQGAAYLRVYGFSDAVNTYEIAYEITCGHAYCGDGDLDEGEECDDGNILDGDGCDTQCVTEAACGPGCVAPELVINEIMYDIAVTADTSGEFIELFNPNPFQMNLQGWRLQDEAGGVTFEEEILIAPHGYFVLGNADLIGGLDAPVDYNYGGRISLRNSGEIVQLLNPEGEVYDEVAYGVAAPWPIAQAGYSIERVDPCAAVDDATNWRSSENDFDGGQTYMTPGQPNSAAQITCP